MEAYGQFAWKLRHYRGGPPASNHSSNGPVCRHLGGRLFCIPYYHSLSRFVLLSPPSFSPSRSSLSAPSAAFMESHDSDSRHSLLERPGKGRIFRLRAKSINDGSARFYRWDRAGSCSTPEHPFLGPNGIYSTERDRYYSLISG